jgi:hypothetical protein
MDVWNTSGLYNASICTKKILLLTMLLFVPTPGELKERKKGTRDASCSRMRVVLARGLLWAVHSR